ncbi:MAG: flagellar hook-length control protein FliK [Dechloromonas sp.]|nr:flagellar hook-length control protein FliK [Dechloromonas sp.]
MIPPDVANSLRAVIPDQRSETNSQAQPVARAQRIADALSNLVPGQRIFAEIQALMPNGTYRAVVAQREITLALPFSAKPGDTLELEVAESDGKLTLAFVANRSSGTNAAASPESVSTSLSTAGKVIGNLLTPLEGEGKQAAPAALNRGQPLVETMPNTAADLAPVLKQALTQSGMFYEAHQARWVTGQLPTTALLQEPQGKLSPAPLNAPEFINRSSNFPPGSPSSNPALALSPDSLLHPSLSGAPASATSLPGSDGLTQPPPREAMDKSSPVNIDPTVNRKFGEILKEVPLDRSAATTPPAPQTTVSTSTVAAPNENPVPRELVPLVQQQLNGLATQNFVWQGQVWPGQPMWWEISGDPESKPSQDNEQASQWQTRLKLDLPALGGIDVTLRLGTGGSLGVSVSAENPASEAKLRNSAQALREQLEAAGLTLTQLRVDHGQAGE